MIGIEIWSCNYESPMAESESGANMSRVRNEVGVSRVRANASTILRQLEVPRRAFRVSIGDKGFGAAMTVTYPAHPLCIEREIAALYGETLQICNV